MDAAAAAVPANSSVGWPSERLRQLNDEIAAQLTPAMLFVALLMLVGLAGNAVVCFVFFFRLRMSAQHVLIMSLAAFDLVSCLIAMPTEIVDMRYFLVFQNEFACRLLRFINFFSAFASILTLVVIAVDRYLKVCRPLGPRLSLRHTKMALASVVAVALVAAVPAPVLYGVRTTSIMDDESGQVLQAHDCSTSDATKTTIYPTAYSCVLFAAFVVTLGALGIIYAKILREMRVHNVYMKRNSVYRCNSTRSRGRAGSVSVISTPTTTCTTDPPSSSSLTQDDDLPGGGWFTAFRNSFRLSRSSRKGGQDCKVPEMEATSASASEGDLPTAEPSATTLTALAGGQEAEAVQMMSGVGRIEGGGEQEGSRPAPVHGEPNLGSPESCLSAWLQPGPELELPPAGVSTPNAGNCPPQIFITPDDDSRVTVIAACKDYGNDPALSLQGGQAWTAPQVRDRGDRSEISCLQLSDSGLLDCSSTDPVRYGNQDLSSVANDRDVFQESPEAAGGTFLEYDYDSSAANDSCLQDWYGVRLNAVGIVLTSTWTQNANYSDTEASEDNPMFLRTWDRQREIDLSSSMNSIASSTPFVDSLHEHEEHVESRIGTHRQKDASFYPTSVYNPKAAITLSSHNEGDDYGARNCETNFVDSCPDSDLEYTCLENEVLEDCYANKSRGRSPSSEDKKLRAVESGLLAETTKDTKQSVDCVATHAQGSQVESHETEVVNSDSDIRPFLHIQVTKADSEKREESSAHICDSTGLDRVETTSEEASPCHSRTFISRNISRVQNNRGSPVTRRALSTASQQEEEQQKEEEQQQQSDDQNHQQQGSSIQPARPTRTAAKRKLSKKNSSSSSSAGMPSKTTTPEAAVRTSKATAVAIAVTCVFFFSFLPFLALAVGRAVHGDFDRRLRGARLVLYNVFLRFYFLNAVANPLIYGLLNSSFRKQCLRLARKVFGFCPPWGRRRCSGRFAVSQS